MNLWCEFFRQEILPDPMWYLLSGYDFVPEGKYLLELELLAIQLDYWRQLFCGG